MDVHTVAADPPSSRRNLIALLGREALLADIAIVVEAFDIDAPAAEVVDELIANLCAPLLVCSHARWRARPGMLHVVPIAALSRAERTELWHCALNSHARSVNGHVDAIVQQFDFGPAAIADIVHRATDDIDHELTGDQLWKICREHEHPGLERFARRIEPQFGWHDIVVADDVLRQLRELSAQVRHRFLVYEKWNFAAQLGRGRGITALFTGVSGTGKTMAAEIVAADLDLVLYRIDLASVVSKYVGETEKNLGEVFDAAERTGAILLFDEADALFGSRTEVRDSHDRYANLEINYLLQRMEDYSGLAVLATNRRAALDAAFMRRLRFVVDFEFPSTDERRTIWERVLPVEAARGAINFGQLARLEIPGGNIRSIAVNGAFLAAADESPIEMAHLFRAAAREYAKLAKPLSSNEFGSWLGLVAP